LFASLEGRAFEKRKEQAEEILGFASQGLWGIHFTL